MKLTTAAIFLVVSSVAALPTSNFKGPIEKCLEIHPAACALTDKAVLRPANHESTRWLLDSGSQVHLCNNKSLMTEIYPMNAKLDGIGGEEETHLAGTVHLALPAADGKEHDLTLYDVLFFADLDTNIMSPNQLKHQGMFYRNDRDEVFTTEPYEAIGQIDRHEDMPFVRLVRHGAPVAERSTSSTWNWVKKMLVKPLRVYMPPDDGVLR